MEMTTIGKLIATAGGSIKTGPFGTMLKASEYTTTGVPVISVGEVGYGVFRLHASTPRVSPELTARLPECILREGDIVFGRKGAVDRSARISAKQDGWFLGSDGIRLRVSPTTDSKFLAYQLQTAASRAWILQHATGTTMPSLNQRAIESVPIRLLPLVEQRAIADVLGAFDEKIEVNRGSIETLESMGSALFKSWFVDFDPVWAKSKGLVPAGMDANTAKLFPSTFAQSPNGAIPQGWRVTSLGREVDRCGGAIQTGPFGSQLHASDYVPEGIPVIMPKDISGRRVSLDTIARIGEQDAGRLSRHRVQLGDLVYSRRGDVERHALISQREAGWLCGTGCLLVRLGAQWPSPLFASLTLDRPETRVWISQHAIGATMPNLNTGILSAVPLVVPSDDVLHAFARRCDPLQDLIVAKHAENATLTQIRDTLLPKLVSREIRIRDV